MERAPQDLFKVNNLAILKSPLPRHIFKSSPAGNAGSSSPVASNGENRATPIKPTVVHPSSPNLFAFFSRPKPQSSLACNSSTAASLVTVSDTVDFAAGSLPKDVRGFIASNSHDAVQGQISQAGGFSGVDEQVSLALDKATESASQDPDVHLGFSVNTEDLSLEEAEPVRPCQDTPIDDAMRDSSRILVPKDSSSTRSCEPFLSKNAVQERDAVPSTHEEEPVSRRNANQEDGELMAEHVPRAQPFVPNSDAENVEKDAEHVAAEQRMQQPHDPPHFIHAIAQQELAICEDKEDSGESDVKPLTKTIRRIGKPDVPFTEWSFGIAPNAPRVTGIAKEQSSEWIVLVGRRPDTSELWHSSIVTGRISASRIETGSGRVYVLEDSSMDSLRMSEHGFCDVFSAKFAKGFPDNWQALIIKELRRIAEARLPRKPPSPSISEKKTLPDGQFSEDSAYKPDSKKSPTKSSTVVRAEGSKSTKAETPKPIKHDSSIQDGRSVQEAKTPKRIIPNDLAKEASAVNSSNPSPASTGKKKGGCPPKAHAANQVGGSKKDGFYSGDELSLDKSIDEEVLKITSPKQAAENVDKPEQQCAEKKPTLHSKASTPVSRKRASDKSETSVKKATLSKKASSPSMKSKSAISQRTKRLFGPTKSFLELTPNCRTRSGRRVMPPAAFWQNQIYKPEDTASSEQPATPTTQKRKWGAGVLY